MNHASLIPHFLVIGLNSNTPLLHFALHVYGLTQGVWGGVEMYTEKGIPLEGVWPTGPAIDTRMAYLASCCYMAGITIVTN